MKGFEKTFRKTVMDRDETGMYGKLLIQGFQNWSQKPKWTKYVNAVVDLKSRTRLKF